MQYINDNNMDDLFQKAAENYPLNIQKNNWGKVAEKLEKPSLTPVVSSKFSWKHLSILLSVFLFSSGGIFLNYYITTKKSNEIIQRNNNKESLAIQLSDNSILLDNKNQTSSNNKKQYEVSPSNNTSSATSYYKIDEVQKSMGAKSRVMIIPASSTDNQTIEKPVKEEKNGVAVGSLLNDSKALIVPDNLNITGDKKSELPIEKQLFASENINKEAATNDISEKTDVSLHTSDKKNNVRGFYAGLILGPQFNQVNSQGFNKVGGEAGLLFGYSFNQKFSVESGLYLSNKKYYSDGKYFNMDKIISAMPTSMKVITVISNTTLLEIPLKAKYNFSSNKNSDLFVTVGVSSYLLLREQNDYQALVNGGQENIKGDYGTMRKYFAASLSLSVGYQKSIGKGTQVRIEPYLEFPIRELGVGSMSVFSTGLHLGIAFPLRKR